jgi:hypothetical protein
MPNVHDKYEALLSDLEDAEEIVREPSWPNLPSAKELAMFARIVLAVRPLLDELNEAHADLEVAQARIAELEAQLAEVRKGFAP